MHTLQPTKIFKFKNDYLNVFVICLITAACIFIPFLIYDKGYFLYYGDFNVQQIPFYKMAQEAVKEGNIFWNWNTDLGANFIGSYSFYLLGSPFFWLTLLFPNSVVPFLMAPLLILKFACAGVSGFAFIKRFTRKNRTAVLGAVLYAFSGFTVYNIFFNHFHEAVIVFPLMLVALEEAVINNRRGWFALTVGLAATVNYFFFVGQVVFILLYFILRCLCPDFPITLKKLGILAFEAVLGVLLSCFLLLPSVLAILGNPRTDSFYYGMNMLFYGNEQRYGLILQSLFFPPDIPARPNFFPDSNAKWSSVSAYLPLFSMTGVIVFFKHYKKHWIKRLLAVSLLMALIPILNSAFYAFNSSYYARWFYMPTLLMALATCITLENANCDYKFGMKLTLGAVLAFTVIGILPTKESDGSIKWFGIPDYPERFWGYVAIALASLLILTILFYLPRKSVRFTRYATLATCFVVVVYSVMIIGTGKSNAAEDVYTQIVDEGLNAAGTFTLDESEFFRVDEDKALDNMPMFWNLPTIQCFHSIVPVSVMEYYQSMGVDRNVASRPDTTYYGVRALTSVKYLFCRTTEEQPTMPGFELLNVQNNYNVYENNYFIPMGFTYDYCVTRTSYDKYSESSRDKLLLKAMCLSDEDAAKYADILPELPQSAYPGTSQEEYFEACTERRATSGSSFTYDTHGFSSTITLDRDNLVFYSVPYEKGWSATVNGESAEIVRSNVGFMAVKASAGDNEIVFHYQTPGLTAGVIITLIALLILAGYLLLVRSLRRRNPERYGIGSHLERNLFACDLPLKTKNAYLTETVKTASEQAKEKAENSDH